MSLGFWQIALILIIVLLLFGAGKIPRLMGDVAKGIKNFKAGMKDEDEASGASGEARQIDADQPQPVAGSANAVGEDTTKKSEQRVG
jgi:sec-independent protein translocase protein TatA